MFISNDTFTQIFHPAFMRHTWPFLLATLLHAVVCIPIDGQPTAATAVHLASLKVNSLLEPGSIDSPRPSFSFSVDALNEERGVVTEAFELEVDVLQPNGSVVPVWRSGVVQSNQTQFIQWPASCSSSGICPQRELSSDSDYTWRVRAYPGPSDWSASTFSTGTYILWIMLVDYAGV